MKTASTDSLPEIGLQFARTQLAWLTGGLAPDDYMRAWWDWYVDLAQQPEKQTALWRDAAQRWLDTWLFAMQASVMESKAHGAPDRSFSAAPWNTWPFNAYVRAYKNFSDWWRFATTTPGTPPSTLDQRRDFSLRQMLDTVSPAHYLHTNPELLEQTCAESGANLVRGAVHLLEDMQRLLAGAPQPATQQYRVGEDVATTAGKVVLRNELMELIQYTPVTEKVWAEPILITPAWIMKYYILDLSPRNSLVKYLVEQGHTVFMISWKNPHREDGHYGLDDYVQLGFNAALDAVSSIVANRKVHAVGYCIGGTLLSISAALLAGSGDDRVASVSLFAAQTDFSEPGELAVFITPSQLALMESIMQRDGVLESSRMAAAFAMMRSADLIWAPAIEHYLRGKRGSVNDLMAWNADGTRMPCRMHTEYLRHLYLHNELASGTFALNGQRANLQHLRIPMFVVGTETDHVAPWQSVYKTRKLTRSSDFTFLLTNGGHNAGIVSGPVNSKRRHRVVHWDNSETAVPAEQLMQVAVEKPGSWWPTWQGWLAAHSAADQIFPPPVGNTAAGLQVITDAPGEYVRG